MSARRRPRPASPVPPLSQRVGRLVGRAGIADPVPDRVRRPGHRSARRSCGPPNLTNILDQQAGIIIVACAGTLRPDRRRHRPLDRGDLRPRRRRRAAHRDRRSRAPVGVLAGLAVGLAVGLANGIIVTRFRINPLIGTLAMSFVVSGIAAIVTKGNLVVALDQPDFQAFAATKILGITSAAWMMIIIAIAATILLSRTTFGRYVYATGGNAQAARLGGVRVDAIRVATFALSGTAAGLAGTLDASRVLSAQAQQRPVPDLHGPDRHHRRRDEHPRRRGVDARTVVGCLFVALIANGFNLLGLDPFYQQVTLGVILLLAVGLDAWSRRFELTRTGHPAPT